MGRSLESPCAPRILDTRPVEIRGGPWRPVESGLIRRGSIINNIGIICDHPTSLCAPVRDTISLGALGADARRIHRHCSDQPSPSGEGGAGAAEGAAARTSAPSAPRLIRWQREPQRPPQWSQMIPMLFIMLPRRIRPLSAGLHGSPRISTGNLSRFGESWNRAGDSGERPI